MNGKVGMSFDLFSSIFFPSQISIFAFSLVVQMDKMELMLLELFCQVQILSICQHMR